MRRWARAVRVGAGAAVGAGVMIGVAGGVTRASADDFWLVPDAFAVTPGSAFEVRGQTSSAFPASKAAVTPDRVTDAKVLTAGGAEPLGGFTQAGASLLVRHRPASAGQRVVAVALRPRLVRESAAGFRRYLVLEGAPEALARYEREGRLPTTDSITRRYAKYAKTIVEVGHGGPRAFGRAAGYPVEFVPLTDPAALAAGDTLAVRLLFRGRPLASARLQAGVHVGDLRATTLERPLPPQPAAAGADAHGAAHGRDVSLTTDAAGVARVLVGGAGVWNVRAIHIVPADAGTGADWDVHWATLVFRVAAGEGGRRAGAEAGAAAPAAAAHAAPGDSAAVARVVTAFDRALEAGDSAGVLALLSADAVVLESGGVESRDEYRAHHLASDIAFARAVRRTHGPVRVTVRGDAAWAASTGAAQGAYGGRAVNSTSAELMVLTREASGWKIRAIHWSSRARRR